MLSILPFLLIIVVLWFVMIRPQQRRQREAQQMQAELTPGAKVMLTSGIFGEVREITDDYIVVEIAETASVKVVRAAIGRVLPEDFGEQPADGVEDVASTETDAAAPETASGGTVEPVEPEDDR